MSYVLERLVISTVRYFCVAQKQKGVADAMIEAGKATGKDKAGKKIWTRIGAVWPNKSGKGFNLTWDYLPLGDGLTVMLSYDKDQGEAASPVM